MTETTAGETGEQKIENLTKLINNLIQNLKKLPISNTPLDQEADTLKALNKLITHNETCTDPDCIIKTKLQKLTPKPEGIKCEDCGEEVPKGKYCINCGEEIPEETEEGTDNYDWF